MKSVKYIVLSFARSVVLYGNQTKLVKRLCVHYTGKVNCIIIDDEEVFENSRPHYSDYILSLYLYEGRCYNEAIDTLQ